MSSFMDPRRNPCFQTPGSKLGDKKLLLFNSPVCGILCQQSQEIQETKAFPSVKLAPCPDFFFF